MCPVFANNVNTADKVEILHRGQFECPLQRLQNNCFISLPSHGANISQIYSLEPHKIFELMFFTSHSTCPQYLITHPFRNLPTLELISGRHLPLFNLSPIMFWKWNLPAWPGLRYPNILSDKFKNTGKWEARFSNWPDWYQHSACNNEGLPASLIWAMSKRKYCCSICQGRCCQINCYQREKMRAFLVGLGGRATLRLCTWQKLNPSFKKSQESSYL